ncbi:MAG: 23S rRNA (pseudouridine(1915)-N(3))-methyltransferase RlmH [Bdellovibrionales bacterium]|nr:23S rRNA (pseudouridine(1915)-N(3))-methyltransferase RlmH [Bdellovibrionales bacterium]
MKIYLYWFPSSKENWLKEFIETYEKKISFYQTFQVEALRVKKAGRESSEIKKEHEEKILLSKIRDSDYVIVFDEKGYSCKDSIEFSQKLVHALESSKQRIVFIIGGAFGLGDKVIERSDMRLSFSKLTYSHQVAMVVGLEQIFRSFTIYKGHPYHNA